MERRTIGQVAREVGMRPSTLRYYERIGLLPPAERISGQRRYSAEIEKRLEMILAAKEIGFSLDEIKLLLDGLSASNPPPERWQAIAEVKLPEVEKLIERARSMKRILEMGLNCECITIADCFEQIKR